MTKSQKKAVAIKPKPIHKAVKNIKSDKSQPKATKKNAVAPETANDSKQSRILALLKRPAGATIDEIAKATCWQRHSVQGMMSGVLKKRLGLTITSDKEERGRVYRIIGSVSRL